MNKAYNAINWKNEPSTSTAINETNLNKMDRAIDTIDNRVIDLDNGKVNKEEGKSLVSDTDISKIGANETAIQAHISDKSNPHSVTKAQVGLGKVDNTSDADKPISTAQQAEFDAINNNLSQLEIDLKMLGYTVPKEMPVKNYVDADGVFHQRVGRVDLGSLEWHYDSNSNYFSSSVIRNPKLPSSNWTVLDNYCSKYENAAFQLVYNGTKDKTCAINLSGSVWVHDSAYTDATIFATAMQGVYLYYELATEQTISVDGNEAVTKVNKSLSVIGKCKNLLNPTLHTTSAYGVTCTANGDGTYTLNGTSTNIVYFQLSSQTFDLSKTYKIVGCPKGGDNKYSIYDDNNTITGTGDKGNGGKPYKPSVNPRLFISIQANVELNNAVFKPMLTENLNATYDDFVPYTGDGDTLTADVAELKSDLSECRKKSDITTNETLIGTFNGKNYYRRLFTGIGASGSSITVNVGEKIEIYNYYGRAYVYGQSGASAAKYPIPNKNYYIDSQNISETSFQLTMPTSSDMRKIDLVIEYTKVDE